MAYTSFRNENENIIRLERYIPRCRGRLPVSAFRQNGIQDQIHGYRGAIKYLCTAYDPKYGPCVHTIVEPLRKLYPKVTQEKSPGPIRPKNIYNKRRSARFSKLHSSSI